MTHRIDDYLDGKVERIALTPEERAVADTLERAIEDTRAFIDGTSVPDMTAPVMRRVRAIGAPRPRYGTILSGIFAGVWARREVSFRFRPVYAAAVLAIVWLIVPASLVRVRSSRTPTSAAATESPRLLVQ